MDQSFHSIWKFHIKAPSCNTGDNSLILLAQMIGHILCFLQLVRFSFRLICTPFTHTGLACHFIQDLLVMLGTSFSYQSASQAVMDDPVDLKIRISSDRRSKMAVIFRRKAKMSAAFGGIFRLFHGTQCQTADLCLIWHSLDAFQDLLDLTWCDLLPGFLYINSFIMKKHQKTFDLFRIRILMGSVYKGIISGTVFLCHGFIGKKHKILNDPGCHIGFIWLYVNGFPCSIKYDLAFRKVKINRTSCMTATT